jgi:hypothetical protein
MIVQGFTLAIFVFFNLDFGTIFLYFLPLDPYLNIFVLVKKVIIYQNMYSKLTKMVSYPAANTNWQKICSKTVRFDLKC